MPCSARAGSRQELRVDGVKPAAASPTVCGGCSAKGNGCCSCPGRAGGEHGRQHRLCPCVSPARGTLGQCGSARLALSRPGGKAGASWAVRICPSWQGRPLPTPCQPWHWACVPTQGAPRAGVTHSRGPLPRVGCPRVVMSLLSLSSPSCGGQGRERGEEGRELNTSWLPSLLPAAHKKIK